jgi:flagellar hook-associated protein 2
MSTLSFSGVGSGIDVESLISRLIQVDSAPLNQLNSRKNTINLKQTQIDNLSSRVTTLNNAVKRLTTPSITTGDPFSTKTATVADKDLLTVTATGEAASQSFTVDVRRLATATTARSIGSLGQTATGAALISQLSQGRVSSGNFTVFANGISNTIAIDRADTLDQVLTRIKAVSGVSDAVIGTDGKLQLTATAGTTLQLGGSSDTSNFLDVTGLKTGTTAGDITTASLALNTLNTNGDLTGTGAGLASPITAGSQFTIGKASFTVSAGKTLNALIADINNTPDAGVVASYNAVTNKMVLSAKTSGSTLITLKDEAGGDALLKLGLIASDGDATESQTAGLTAQFALNGGAVQESSSNTVTDALTGLTGVTLNLTKAQPGTATQVSIASNTSELKNALKDVVSQLNTVFTFIQDQTNAQSTSAQLKSDTTVLRFRSEIRTLLSSPATGVTAPYNNLAAIGFSTGAITGASSGSATSTYSLNETKLDEALAANPEAVKNLLVGANGIITQLSTKLTKDLDPSTDVTQSGLFSRRKQATETQIKNINSAIARAQTRLDAKEKLYRTQFQQMDRLISQYQSQGNAISRIGQ